MKSVLVAYASRHGSTADIAETIGGVISAAGFHAAVHPVGEVLTVSACDALILGSAVYMDNWLPEAQDVVEANLDDIVARPTWLFSSGSVGSFPAVPFDGSSLVERTGARDHHLFGGQIQRSRLSLGERLVASLLRVPASDDRDWAVVIAWATAIARSLEAVPA